MTVSAYDGIRELILTNALPANEPLVETALAEQFGVSRTPIRDALRRLEQDGLVERFGRGVRVRELSPEEILEIYEVRETLEAAAARAAANRRTELDLSRLAAIHEEMLALGENLDERVALNNRFHETLWQASHNSTLQESIGRLIMRLRRHPHTTLEYPGRWERVLTEHQEMLDAIRDREADRAAEIATVHMSAARDVRLRIYATNPDGLRGQ
ncbi:MULTISPECIES: GntR family transcriptional regulator [unclassified Microbacterium]|uniref:GntR family transcriptional regulator n=1 Tax=unclassified Microbacterium TaxID=2609290 RepID=UPI00203AC710|nr:GntR family transcriptional regulator [Microbacterium sp. USTB-Y]